MTCFTLVVEDDFSTLQKGVVLVGVFKADHKIYDIHTLAVGFAVGAKAKGRVGFVVHLQARGFILVERAMQPHGLVGF